MNPVARSFRTGVFGLALTIALTTYGFAQGGATSSISGTVTDASGAVIPGADIVAKNNATSAESRAVSSASGTFTIPALNAGTYTLTVTLMGFKTVTLKDVVVNAGIPASVKATMEIGGVEENVVVQAASDIVQTQTATVATTLSVNQISKLPLTSRNALDFVVNLPGTNTASTARNSNVNGLPQSAINITLDGMNIQDNYLKTTDGFFARLSPRLDAVEEVTVTAAVNGADSAGQGAVNIRFVTRSGSDRFTGSSYLYYRNDSLNANTWFNNRDLPPDPTTGKAPKNDLLQYQPGTRVGGPILIPGVYDGRGKAFFFVNYEENRTPSKSTLTRTILSPQAQQGIFQYTAGGGVRSVPLLPLAAANNQTATLDPTVAKLLADIRSSTSQGQVNSFTDPNLQRFTFQTPVTNYTPAPSVRIDYNLSRNHRLTGTGNYQHINSDPDTTNGREPRFPGFPHTGSQQSTRYSTSNWLRSTLGTNIVNEFRVGATGGATQFSPELNPTMWAGTLANQGGLDLNFNGACCGNNNAGLANAASTTGFSSREASTKVIDDTLDWIKGSHSLRFGVSFTRADLWLKNQTLVPQVNFGIPTGDPADVMFNTANSATNFPGASSTQVTNARNLYAMLTGHINSITATSRINEDSGQYEFLGLGTQRGRMWEYGVFAQDTWRMRQNLTLTYGVRYELQRPFYPRNNSYSTATVADVCGISGTNPTTTCNLFSPNVRTGAKPVFVGYGEGAAAFKTDYNNFAPSVGLVWTPSRRSGVLGAILGGDGDSVLRGGYALAYERHGMSDFSDVFGANPGVSVSANRDATTNTLILDGAGLPLLLRESGRLGAGPFPLTQQYPFTEVITGDINIFDPNLEVPYSQSWTGSWQRKITRDIAVDIRYVGTRHLQDWIEYNYNEANIVENGFLDEFRRAQANLEANIAQGRGATFRYFGAGTGTSPLPIYLAYFTGRPSSQAGDPAAYTGTAWTNSNFVNPLAKYNPNPFTPAGTNSNTGLDGDPARRANALAAGLSANFFRANPDLLGGANITGNGSYTRYDSFQLELTKRLSHGVQMGGSYVFGNAYQSNRYGFRKPRYKTLQTGQEGGITHALKLNWTYELPFGAGRRFLSNANGLLDRIVGGWEFDGIARVTSGRMLDFGNVRLVGMSADELKDSLGLQEFAVTGLNPTAAVALYLMPKDIVENTVRAFSTSATTASGYGDLGAPTGRYLAPANTPECIEVTAGSGDCGVRSLVITGPKYVRFDLSAAKRVRLGGRFEFLFSAEMLNAFNHPNFVPVIATTNNSDNYRITDLNGEATSRTIQLVFRLNW
jgi:Carboxypeptidase regulatory-like domain